MATPAIAELYLTGGLTRCLRWKTYSVGRYLVFTGLLTVYGITSRRLLFVWGDTPRKREPIGKQNTSTVECERLFWHPWDTVVSTAGPT